MSYRVVVNSPGHCSLSAALDWAHEIELDGLTVLRIVVLRGPDLSYRASVEAEDARDVVARPAAAKIS